MDTITTPPKTPSKLDTTLEQLQKGLDELFDSARYKTYLDTMSKFHNYSVNNCLLINSQAPDSTRVASYTTWQQLHRQVKKGEKGITIIAPSPHKTTKEIDVIGADGQKVLDANGNPVTEVKEYVRQAFKTATVFDISQTEGKPLPEIASLLTDPVDDFDDYLDVIKEISPVPVRFDAISGEANGYYSHNKQEIVIRRGLPEEQTLKTLLHECAHARLGHGSKDNHIDRNTREVQAESIAYVCCKALGLDTSDYSFGYIAGWSSGKDQKELKASLNTIRTEADLMITAIEAKLTQIMEVRKERQIAESQDIQIEGPKMSF